MQTKANYINLTMPLTPAKNVIEFPATGLDENFDNFPIQMNAFNAHPTHRSRIEIVKKYCCYLAGNLKMIEEITKIVCFSPSSVTLGDQLKTRSPSPSSPSALRIGVTQGNSR